VTTTIDRLRATARDIDDSLTSSVEVARRGIVWVIVGVALLALVAFLLGRRGGKKVVVEVRRR